MTGNPGPDGIFLISRQNLYINNRQVLSCLENIVRRKEIWQVNYMV